MEQSIMHFFLGVGHYTYLLLHIFIVAFPLSRSFENRVAYATKWKYLWRGLLITAAFMIFWDVLFTYWGVWSFNPDYVIGLWPLGLPIEEWLFFITAPFSCIFIYECVLYFLPDPETWKKYSLPITWLVISGLAIVALFNYDKIYTSVKLGLAALALIIHVLVFGNRYLGRFWITYLLHLIPFFLINGVLTFLPVVSYNPSTNLGIRFKDIIGIPFFNIPIEDSLYSLLLLVMNVSFYEFEKKRIKQTSLNLS
jgi:lycopene cyclase domain-containing protein